MIQFIDEAQHRRGNSQEKKTMISTDPSRTAHPRVEVVVTSATPAATQHRLVGFPVMNDVVLVRLARADEPRDPGQWSVTGPEGPLPVITVHPSADGSLWALELLEGSLPAPSLQQLPAELTAGTGHTDQPTDEADPIDIPRGEYLPPAHRQGKQSIFCLFFPGLRACQR